MSSSQNQPAVSAVAAAPKTTGQRFLEWMEEPLGQIVVASMATIGSFGLVMSGIWFVNILVN